MTREPAAAGTGRRLPEGRARFVRPAGQLLFHANLQNILRDSRTVLRIGRLYNISHRVSQQQDQRAGLVDDVNRNQYLSAMGASKSYEQPSVGIPTQLRTQQQTHQHYPHLPFTQWTPQAPPTAFVAPGRLCISGALSCMQACVTLSACSLTFHQGKDGATCSSRHSKSSSRQQKCTPLDNIQQIFACMQSLHSDSG